MRISKDDAPKRETTLERRHHPIHRSRVSPRRRQKDGRKLHLNDAYKKETVPVAPPSPAPANSQEQVFTRICSRRPPSIATTFKFLSISAFRPVSMQVGSRLVEMSG
jgi:hypothetical protein